VREEIGRALIKFYESYRYQLEMSGKLKPGASLLIACIRMKKNDRYRPLIASAMDGRKISSPLLTQLKEQKLIRSAEDVSRFVITGRGIWEAERLRGLIDEDVLLDFIDENYFGQLFDDAKPLTDKEKVVLLSLIAARTFSEESSVDMKRHPEVNAAWLRVFKASAEKLRAIGAITATDDDLFPKDVKYEDTASHFIRHTDQLPRKTRAIYASSKKRDNKYYLQVANEGKIDMERLAYLVWLIAGNNMCPENVDDFCDFCTSIAYDFAMLLFEYEKHVFASPQYDEALRNAVIDSIVSRHKWEAPGT
jgi:hypothetical protein